MGRDLRPRERNKKQNVVFCDQQVFAMAYVLQSASAGHPLGRGATTRGQQSVFGF